MVWGMCMAETAILLSERCGHGRGGMKWQGAIVFALAIASSSCTSPRVAPEDFCKVQGRRIPDKERIAAVLVNLVKDEDRYSNDIAPDGYHYDRGGMHYFAWRRSYRADHSNSPELDVANAYVSAYPGCCAVVPPTFPDSKKVPDEIWYEIDPTILSDWVAEVQIWTKFPFGEKSNDNQIVSRAVSACNNKINHITFMDNRE